MKIVKIIHSIVSAVLIACLLICPVQAFYEENTPVNWYFKKNDNHQRPQLDSGLKFIEDYDCLYLGKDEKVIYLTFDAGYENGNVKKVLDAMKKHQAKGAFFILDNLIKRNPELVRRMESEGHLVCNHTAKHPDMSAITDKKLFKKQLSALEKSYTECTGKRLAPFYRPPQGRFSRKNLKFAEELGYTTVLWSFAYADWDNKAQPD